MNKEDIFRYLQENSRTLQAFGVNRLGLFGSFQRGEQNSESDVDVLVVFEPNQKTFKNFMDLCFFLEDILGRKVDVLTPESLSPYFGNEILAEVEYVSFS
jgi:predicted nucleotidyltransferase